VAIDEAAYMAGYRSLAKHEPIAEIELEGVTLRKGDCVTVDHWMHGKTRDRGKFQYAWRERKHLTALVWTEKGGFRTVPTRMVHPCKTGEAK
jgi:hypothetical protein